MSQPRFLPGHLQMRDEARHQNQVDGALAHHLIGNADPTGLRVLRLPLHRPKPPTATPRPGTLKRATSGKSQPSQPADGPTEKPWR